MAKRRTNQECQILIEQSESSSLSTLAFCKHNALNPSTFYAKRQQLRKLMKVMVESDHITMEKVRSIVNFWAYSDDLPNRNFRTDYEQMFGLLQSPYCHSLWQATA